MFRFMIGFCVQVCLFLIVLLVVATNAPQLSVLFKNVHAQNQAVKQVTKALNEERN